MIFFLWYGLAAVLELFQFKGSCEWCLTKCMRKQSSRNNILASIDSKSMYEDCDGIIEEDRNVVLTCHQMCFCCCCCWSKVIGRDELNDVELSNVKKT